MKTAGTGKAAAELSPAKAPPAKVLGKDRDMGSALRSVYRMTVEEEIPADLLDLLGKLD